MDNKQAYIVSKLKGFLIDNYTPEMIILYGSTARGDNDEFSDIDIMVIMDVEDEGKVSAEILADTEYIVHEKHIMLRSVDDFYNQRDIPGTMVYSALSEGQVLFLRPGFNTDHRPVKSYEERKKGVIKKEYLAQAHEFLEKGKIALDKRRFFRCRDFLRFAAVRALKAVMVFRDVHPPRGTDPGELFEKALELNPQIKKLQPLINELNDFCPEGSDPGEIIKCRGLIKKVKYFIDNVAYFIKGINCK